MSSESPDDILAASPPSIVKAAGGLSLGAGAAAILIVIQAFSGFIISGSAAVWLGVLGLVGLIASIAGLGLLRARAWSGTIGIGADVVLTLVSGVWLLRAAAGGFFSLFGLVTPWIALAATCCAIGGRGALKKVILARERLRAQGLDLGT